MTFSEQLTKIAGAFKRHAPEILTGTSVVGLGATVYLSVKAGYKSGVHVVSEFSTRLDNASDDEEVLPMSGKEIVQDTWKFYIPVVVVGVATAIAIVGSNRVSNSQKLALFSAAAISERALSEYQQKIVETTSKPKERKIQDDIAQDRVVEKKDEYDQLVPKLTEGDVLCLETYTGRTFISTAEKIHRAENDANRQCLHDGFITANDFFSLLGLPYTDAGEVVGWNNDDRHRLEVKIGGAVHNENQPVLTVGYYTPPSVKFNAPF